MGRSFVLLLASALLIPAWTLAATPAGFATGSLWLSKTSAAAGESVKVYTVVYDSASAAIAGDVEFRVDGTAFATQHVSLNAGESQIVSAEWNATNGSHTFSAQLKNISGISDALSATQTNEASIDVAAAPSSPIAQYTTTITTYIASTSPTAANIIRNIASTTENWRAAGSDYLSAALAAQATRAPAVSGSVADTGPTPEVLGTSTERLAPVASAQKSLISSLWTTALRIALYVFQVQWLFYLTLLVVLYIIYKLIRTLFLERRHSYHG